MAAIPLIPSRVLRRPRRLDRRAVLGLFLLLIALTGSIAFWSSNSGMQAVVIAARDAPTGTVLSASDLAVAQVRVAGAIYQRAIPGSELESLVGKQATEPLHSDQIIVTSQVSSQLPLGPNQMAFTIPVTADTAAGGAIQPGDVVEVLVTTGKGSPNPQSSVVLPRVKVYDVGYSSGIATINTTGSAPVDGSARAADISWVTLIVTQGQALQLAHAKWAGQLDVALRPN